jgi:mevalonate kinase
MSDTKCIYICRGGDGMRKVQKLSIRLTQSDFEKLRLIAGDKPVSEAIRELIQNAYGEVKKESQSFQNLISAIDRLNQQLAVQTAGKDREGFLVILEALKVLSSYLIVMQDRRNEVTKILDQLKEKL